MKNLKQIRIIGLSTLLLALGSPAWSQDIGSAPPGPKNSIHRTIKQSQLGGSELVDPLYDPYIPSHTPWFNNADVREQFNLSEAQYNRLNRAYMESLTRYNEKLAALQPDLAVPERTRQREILYGKFQDDFSTGINDV